MEFVSWWVLQILHKYSFILKELKVVGMAWANIKEYYYSMLPISYNMRILTKGEKLVELNNKKIWR
jgi:hypothetical protein